MKRPIFISIVFCFFVAAIPAQETDAERRGLRGRVKFEERYETYFCCMPNQRKQLPRRLAGTTTFNKKGGYVEWVSVNNTSDGPYYTRRVFKYDERGRKVGADEFRSDRNPPETYFELVRGTDGSVRLRPERAERLVERVRYTLDEKGRIIEIVSRDQNENLIFHHVHKLDSKGRNVRTTQFAEGGQIKGESATVYYEDGERAETVGLDQQGSFGLATLRYDREGRFLKGERYKLKPEAAGKVSRYVRESVSSTSYKNGGGWTTVFVHYDNDGAPSSKGVTTYSARDEVLSREEFTAGPLSPGGRNEDIEPPWAFRERTLYRREYDKRGNAVRSETREQRGPELPMELTNIYESVITYY